ncbi:hypothetical protein [Candidatus Endomicrobiellum agilis]|uniref:hypothetical protein n=1 Tax=Candidatus Endomicrobiellum agilis TaxID=3238957 RepID=UPI003582F0C4|nr:hypothetical protein [Endomicrobium sp.]
MKKLVLMFCLLALSVFVSSCSNGSIEKQLRPNGDLPVAPEGGDVKKVVVEEVVEEEMEEKIDVESIIIGDSDATGHPLCIGDFPFPEPEDNTDATANDNK